MARCFAPFHLIRAEGRELRRVTLRPPSGKEPPAERWEIARARCDLALCRDFDKAPVVVWQNKGADLEIGPRIGKHHIEPDPPRPGLQQPIDQASPHRLKQRPRKSRKIWS